MVLGSLRACGSKEHDAIWRPEASPRFAQTGPASGARVPGYGSVNSRVPEPGGPPVMTAVFGDARLPRLARLDAPDHLVRDGLPGALTDVRPAMRSAVRRLRRD